MKYIQSFETFDDKINESFFPDFFKVVKSKISSFLDAKVSQYVIQGIDYVKNNPDSPEVQGLVSDINNLSEEDKAKLFELTNNKNAINDVFNNIGSSTYESVNLKFGLIKRILSKVAGYGVILGSLAHTLYRIVNTVFINGSIANVEFIKSNTFAILSLIIGLLIGCILLYKEKPEEPEVQEEV